MAGFSPEHAQILIPHAAVSASGCLPGCAAGAGVAAPIGGRLAAVIFRHMPEIRRPLLR
jgi:hypothetical protein